MAGLCLFTPADSLRAQATTTTTLSIENTSSGAVTSVSSGTVVVLTAGVTASGSNVTHGTVDFCDANATYCEDQHLFGTAQVTSHGTATFKFKPAPGVHNYVAKYLGTTAYQSSSSATESLTVTANTIATSTSITQTGTAGNYTLSSTVTSSGNSMLPPTGTVDYLDTSNSNYVLASATLTPGPATSSYAPFVGYNPGGTLGVIVADFNQDGIPDLLVWSEGSNVYGGTNDLAVLLGKGDGTYGSPRGYNFGPSADAPNAVAVADLNGDGYPDVIVSDPGTAEIYVLLNNANGDGSLNWLHTYGFPGYSYNGLPYSVGPVTGVAIGDVNGDGKPDLAVTFSQYGSPIIPYPNSYNGANEFGIMLGNGDGTFQTGSSYPWTSSAYQSGFPGEVVDYPEPIELVDTRRKGLLDAVVTDSNESNVCVSLNNGDGTYAGPNCYSAPAGESVAVGDLNGDGYPDLVVTSFYSQNGSTEVLLGSSTGTYTTASYLPSSVTSAALADLNGDGKLDVVLGSNEAEPGGPGEPGSPGTIAVAYGNGDGTFGTVANINATIVGDAVGDVAVADLNGDGVPDILATDNPATVNVMLGSVTTSATASATGISPVGPVTNSDSVVADYQGDDYFSTSTSSNVSETPQPVPTTLSLQSNQSVVTVGTQITLTATISPGSAQNYSPSGSVVFYMNGTSIGSVTPTNGVAVLMPRLTVVQTDIFTASFAGDSNFVSSNSTTAPSVMVEKAATTLTLQVCNYVGSNWICPATTSNYGGEISLTAQLTPYNVTGGGSSDGETITFYNGTNVLGQASLSGGYASITLDQPAAGVYSITASYGGDANFVLSNSTASPMTIAKITPTVTLQVSPASPTTYGAPIYLTATFQTYPYVPDNTESASFYNGTTLLGTAQFVGGYANLTLNNLPVGSYNFNVSYAGDSNYNSAHSSPSSMIVQKAQTTLMINTGGISSGPYGNPLPLYAVLSWPLSSGGNTPNGDQIAFYQNGSLIGYGTVVNGTAMYTVNVPPTGTDTYSATYAGDPSFASSNASSPAFYQPTQLATSMGLSTNATNGIIATGQPLTLTATLSPYAVTGGASTNGDSVTFYQNSAMIGTGTFTNGVATLVVNGLAEGNYTFGAIYGGDPAFSGSSSSVHPNVTVLQATTLTVTTNPVNYATPNQSVSITATLSPYTVNGHSTNGESVYFSYNGNQFGSATLTNGVATLTEPNGLITPGSYSFTAQFLSDGVLAPSTSTAVPFLVATTEDFVVNTNGDDSGTASNCTPQDSTISNSTDGSCSLRDALLAAAAAPEGASITFDQNVFTLPNYVSNPALNTITLANGTLTVPSNTTITGATWTNNTSHAFNLVTVTANGSNFSNTFTVFDVTGTGVAINSLTISGGFPIWNNGNPSPGGGIINSGTLTLTNSEVTGNGSIVSGGGIYNTGTLTVIGSTIDNNQAAYDGFGNGGGIDNESNGTLNVVNSTIANNSVTSGYGGGISVESGTATITNSTLSGNTVGGGGGGIYNPGGTVNLANSIVSGNSDILTDIKGSYTNKGGNIVASLNGTTINNPNNLNLASLGDYGGYTPTMLPLPGSQAICGGTLANSPNQWQPQSIQIDTDQRGFPNYTESYQPYGGPALCVDAGADQTSYTLVQFYQSGYTTIAGGAVTPTVLIAVAENGQNRGGIPITLNYSGPGNLSGNTSTTAEYAGATFPGLSVDTAGSGTLSATLNITPCVTECSYVQLKATANLSVLSALQISPGGGAFFAGQGAAYSQTFSVTGGSGSYQLSSSGSVPPGMTLTPSGTASGTSWILSGTSATAGTYNFTLTATDATYSAFTTTQNYTITIAPASTTVLTASPSSSTPYGQTVTLTATVSPNTATGTVTFYDGGSAIGPGAVTLSGGSPNTATLALNASTLGSPLGMGGHSFTAQYSGDTNDTSNTSNTVSYTVTPPNFVVNTTSDDNGLYACAMLLSSTSNTTDGNSGGSQGLCTLRDAIASASSAGAGNVYFDTTVFAASNLTTNSAANTVFLDTTDNGSISLQSNTTIQGLTSGNGASLTNLVTVDGGGTSNPNSSTMIVAYGSGSAINNLNFNNGYASNGNSGGAVTNFATLTITGSSFNGNQATGSGGAIYNIDSLTVTNSTFNSNSATGGNGGAIDNSNYSGCGFAAIVNSTFYQNSAANGGGGLGGAVNNDGGGCILTIGNSTLYGNSTDSTYGGGGIYNGSQLYMANSVVSSDTSSGAADDVDDYGTNSDFFEGAVVNGDLIGTYNGGPQNGINVGLAPLGNYGGPTQTLIPFPGSAAICAGLSRQALDQNGNPLSIDQRGDPIAGGGYCPSGSVDSGAVQTSYAISFTTQPSAIAVVGQTIAPSPVVSLTESGAAFTTANASAINMTDSASLLGGTTSEGFSSGTANFNNLTISAPTSNDILTASLPLNGALNLTTQASQGISVIASGGTLVPSSGTLSTSQTFTWNGGGVATKFDLKLGTAGFGSTDLLNTGFTTATSATVTIPSNGVTVYASFFQLISNVWQKTEYTFTEPGSTTPATLSPSSGTLATSQTFSWNNGAGPAEYLLKLGTTGFGSAGLLNTGDTTATSAAVSIPANGVTVYATFFQLINNVWQKTEYTFTEPGSPTPATLSPNSGTLSTSQTFDWSNGSGPAEYLLKLGTTGFGTTDLLNTGYTTATSATVTIPANGVTVYASFFQLINNAWQKTEYTFTEPGSTTPATLSPNSGTLSSSQTFDWSNGAGPTEYLLKLGTTGFGSTDLLNTGFTTATSATVAIPSNGKTVYASFFQLINNVWQKTEYTFTE